VGNPDLRGAIVDVKLVPGEPKGTQGIGTIHHVALRTANAEEQLFWQDEVRKKGLDVTKVMDRTYFQSIYFREPGGVLLEIATEGPGFTADEDFRELGTQLKLPTWMESRRGEIEAALPPLRLAPEEAVE
jgi:glyoxalase family protein